MKRYLIICLVVLLFFIPVANSTNISLKKSFQTNADEDFSHNVLVEFIGTTECPHCHTASNQLQSIFTSGEYDVQYVSLVVNENYNIYDRAKELGVNYVPHVFFDGGYKDLVGGQENELPYKEAVNSSGLRDIPDIDMSIDVQWIGGSLIKSTVLVENNEPEDYNGLLRLYIVEPESRWKDKYGDTINFGVLDIPLEKTLSISHLSTKSVGDTYKFTNTWFGALHGFADITQDNIIVVASIFDRDTGYAVQTAIGSPNSDTSTSLFQMLVKPFTSIIHNILDKYSFISKSMLFLDKKPISKTGIPDRECDLKILPANYTPDPPRLGKSVTFTVQAVDNGYQGTSYGSTSVEFEILAPGAYSGVYNVKFQDGISEPCNIEFDWPDDKDTYTVSITANPTQGYVEKQPNDNTWSKSITGKEKNYKIRP